MMRLLLDLQALHGHARHRGLGRYSLEFAAALAARPEVTDASVVIAGGLGGQSTFDARAVIQRRIPRAHVIAFDAPWPWLHGDSGSVAGHQRAERVRDQLVRELDPDVVVVCSLFELPITSVISIEEQGPFTVTIGYDLLPSTDPDCAWPVHWRDVYDHRMASLRRTDLILSISDHSSNEFTRVMGPSCPPVRTIWGAPGDLDTAAGHMALPLEERTGVLCAGGADPRKNQISTMEAFAKLPHAIRSRHPLLIQGNRSLDETRGLIRRAADLGVDPQDVRVLGANLEEAELRELFGTARLVTMPSLGEGLGLPVLEAWALGTPAIASSTTSLGEVVGDPRWTFDPLDVDAQSLLLERLLTEDTAWQEAAAHGLERAGFFTWDRTALRAMREIITAHPRFRGAMATSKVGPPPVPEEPLALRRTLAWVTSGASTSHARESLLAGLGKGYDLSVVESPAPCYVAAFDRVLFDIADGPRLPDVLACLRQGPGVAVVTDAAAVEAALVDMLSESERASLPYLAAGVLGIASPTGATLVEVVRSSLGVLLIDEVDYEGFASTPWALPVNWVCMIEDASESSAREHVESCYARAPLALDEDAIADGSLAALVRNRPDRTRWTLYHDITRPREHPGRSGIQRVTAALARNLVDANPGRTCLVGLNGSALEHDLSLVPEFVGVSPGEGIPAGVVAARPGDVLLITEINPESAQWHTALEEWRSRGGICVQVVYDLLPILLEDFFPSAKGWFTEWLTVFTRYADILVCDSQAAALDLRTWLAENPPDRPTPPVVTWMRLGHDLGSGGVPAHPRQEAGTGRKRVLMVGTIEPRKGVEVLLDAAHAIWSDGHEVDFVVVGRPGWALPSLLARLGSMAEDEPRLTWLQDASDEDLLAEYNRADLLVMPSRGEGFGLPIVEALAHGMPVVARDLPVFRELLGDTDSYFSRDSDLGAAILRRLSDPSAAVGVSGRLVTWRETAEELLGIIEAFKRA